RPGHGPPDRVLARVLDADAVPSVPTDFIAQDRVLLLGPVPRVGANDLDAVVVVPRNEVARRFRRPADRVALGIHDAHAVLLVRADVFTHSGFPRPPAKDVPTPPGPAVLLEVGDHQPFDRRTPGRDGQTVRAFAGLGTIQHDDRPLVADRLSVR